MPQPSIVRSRKAKGGWETAIAADEESKAKTRKAWKALTEMSAASEMFPSGREELCIVFKARGAPEHAHLDNCTARKKIQKDQLKVEETFHWSQDQNDENQATKSTGWMPWHHTPMKDVVSCEKLRGAASRQRSVDIRMGEPGRRRACHRKMNP